MADTFTNSLIINAIDGIITDSLTKTDSYYRKYDKEFDVIEENRSSSY